MKLLMWGIGERERKRDVCCERRQIETRVGEKVWLSLAHDNTLLLLTSLKGERKRGNLLVELGTALFPSVQTAGLLSTVLSLSVTRCFNKPP